MSVPDRRGRWWLARAVVAAAGFMSGACHGPAGSDAGAGPAASASAGPSSLPPELASRVLARVGDRTITLGDYAAQLSRMDRFERLRYQTADRRKQLLDEMINEELLAREAERRGLASRPETQELVRQILRDELLRNLRDRQPNLEDIPASQVRAYYEAHRNDFREPERRRISAIELKDRPTAERVLAEARAASPRQWGELAVKYGADKKGPDAPPVELAGDLGLLTPPAFGKNENPRVPEPVRLAAFQIEKAGDVLPRVVEAGGKFYVVRLTGKNDPRDRSLEEADRTIRVRLVQERLHEAEEQLEQELRRKFPVKIDAAALAKVQVPDVSRVP